MKNAIKKLFRGLFGMLDDIREDPCSAIFFMCAMTVGLLVYLVLFFPIILPFRSIKAWAESNESGSFWSHVKHEHSSFW